jgi:UDPglucose 6-dehydrogenase
MGQDNDYPMTIVEAVHQRNLRQRQRFAEGIISYFGDRCPQTTLAVWGLAFKARTDDIRESPAIHCIRMFLQEGIAVRAHDPEALDTTREELGNAIELFADGYEALEGADALVVFTDWQEFRTPDFDRMASLLKKPLIFDGRNLYERASLSRKGFEYHCIGRPETAS